MYIYICIYTLHEEDVSQVQFLRALCNSSSLVISVMVYKRGHVVPPSTKKSNLCIRSYRIEDKTFEIKCEFFLSVL